MGRDKLRAGYALKMLSKYDIRISARFGTRRFERISWVVMRRLTVKMDYKLTFIVPALDIPQLTSSPRPIAFSIQWVRSHLWSFRLKKRTIFRLSVMRRLESKIVAHLMFTNFTPSGLQLAITDFQLILKRNCKWKCCSLSEQVCFNFYDSHSLSSVGKDPLFASLTVCCLENNIICVLRSRSVLFNIFHQNICERARIPFPSFSFSFDHHWMVLVRSWKPVWFSSQVQEKMSAPSRITQSSAIQYRLQLKLSSPA
jgi:hypothetical protein